MNKKGAFVVLEADDLVDLHTELFSVTSRSRSLKIMSGVKVAWNDVGIERKLKEETARSSLVRSRDVYTILNMDQGKILESC